MNTKRKSSKTPGRESLNADRSETALARRRFLQSSAAGVAVLSGSAAATTGVPESWTRPGGDFSNYGQPHADQKNIIRWISQARSAPGDGVSWTPLQDLEGIITPNGLHFERHHNGVPALDSQSWQMVLHGLVDKSLSFDLDSLKRYPMTS
ncbi:MAG: hypothetical protein KTR32_37125, partial [Granulosicoccus sp.]|nr:hypothetical protein [Granulosicoccus sp.]